jgi:hypothetical protein
MRGLGCGRAGIGDHQGPVAEVGTGSCGALDSHVGGDPGDDNGVDSGAAQDNIEVGAMKATNPVMGQDYVIAVWCNFVDDGRRGCSVDETPVLRNLTEQGDVGHQVGVAGLEGACGVDDLDAGGAGLAKQPSGGRDQVGSLHLGVKQVGESAVRPDDVVLEIDRDDRGAPRVDALLLAMFNSVPRCGS